MRTYLLFEIANSHGGSKNYIYKLIDALPQEKNTGVKFQVFKYNEIALKDYDYYKVYVKFFLLFLSFSPYHPSISFYLDTIYYSKTQEYEYLFPIAPASIISCWPDLSPTCVYP